MLKQKSVFVFKSMVHLKRKMSVFVNLSKGITKITLLYKEKRWMLVYMKFQNVKIPLERWSLNKKVKKLKGSWSHCKESSQILEPSAKSRINIA